MNPVDAPARARQIIKSQPRVAELAKLADITVHTVVRWMAELPINKRSRRQLEAAFPDFEKASQAAR